MITFSYNDPNDDNQNYPAAVAIMQGESMSKQYTVNVDPTKPDVITRTRSFTLFIFPTVAKGRRNKKVLGRLDYTVPAEQFDQYFNRAALRNVAAPAQGGSDYPVEFQCEAFAIAKDPVLFAGAVQS